MKIGHVDLDTSHPSSWIPIEREKGHEVVGVWDGGSVHPPGYAKTFAGEHDIPRVFESLEEMASEVDCAIIHSCDWDTHVEKARPFIDAGNAVLIDKPVAGNVRDLRQFQAWAAQGARVTGGSALRFCREVREWLSLPLAERGRPHTVFCGCAVDEFNYGIHAYSMLSGIMGPGLQCVRHLGTGVQRRIQAAWDDGQMGFLAIGRLEGWLPFYGTIVTEKAATLLPVDHNQLYRALLDATLPYLAGETAIAPVPMDDLIEPELAAIAARKSWLGGDGWVRLDELQESDEGYHGAAFAEEYKSTKYSPQSSQP